MLNLSLLETPISMSFPTYTFKSYLQMALLFLAYLLMAQVFSYVYDVAPTSPAIIWPASGIALAGLILGGIGLWPALALAAFVHQLLYGAPLMIAIGLAIANVVQPVIATWLLKRLGFINSFSRVQDTLIFILIALFVTIIIPALGTLTFTLAERALPLGITGTFIPWWIGQILSALIITPLLIRWLPHFSFERTRSELTEAWLSIATITALGFIIYWAPLREIAGVPLVYLILVPLLWIALRIGPRFMTLALFMNAAIALSGTAYVVLSSGTAVELGSALLQMQIFLIMISLIFLVLVTVAEERKDTANDLRENVRTLEDAVERIRKEDETKSRFIATLAHELRNPLAPLMSSVEILDLERGQDQRINELTSGMNEHLRTMRHLLDDLLDISRISREKLSLQKENIDLQTILSRSMRSVNPLIVSKGQVLTCDMPDTAITLEADPVRLEQVFVNLLNNATKYTDSGGTITVTASVMGSDSVVSVRDTGIGMDIELLDTVFEPFFQIDQPGKPRAGLGIGLSLTKNLVELHGGYITAASEGLGLGSIVTVRIPRSDITLDRPIPTPGSAEEREIGGFRILIVDDNRAAADALVKLLTLRGNIVEAVYTGEEALVRAPMFRPDVILLDIGLPDMEGYDVARAIRSESRVDAVLIALTGYGQESDIRKASKAGFNHHLTKPAGLAEIEAILQTLKRT